MQIKYRIIKVDEEKHSFVVRYYTDLLTEDDLCSYKDNDGEIIRDENGYPVACKTDTNITIFDIISPTQDDIINRIQIYAEVSRCYLEVLEAQFAQGANTIMANVTSLLNVTGTVIANT